jgi:hypothetical protein
MIVKYGFYLMLSITYKASLGCISSIFDIKWLVVGTIYNETMAYLLGFGCHSVPLQRHKGRYTLAIFVILLEILENPANIFTRYLLFKKIRQL